MKFAAIAKDKRYPNFIQQGLAKTKGESIKWFPLMGLKNCSEDLSPVEATAIKAVPWRIPKKSQLKDQIETLYCLLEDGATDLGHSEKEYALKKRINEVIFNLRSIHDRIGDSFTSKVRVPLVERPSLAPGQSVLPILSEMAHYILADRENLLKVVDSDLFDTSDDLITDIDAISLSSPKKPKYKIVFSMAPWDIATMSMRGIHSCMRWTSNHSPSLVGSIVDPCCGVIYMTDGGTTKYGSLMNARAVVRIVKSANGPRIWLDRPYNSNLNLDTLQIRDIFESFLKRHLKKEYREILVPTQEPKDTKAVFRTPLTNMTDVACSYMDAGNGYTKEVYSAAKLFKRTIPKKTTTKTAAKKATKKKSHAKL